MQSFWPNKCRLFARDVLQEWLLTHCMVSILICMLGRKLFRASQKYTCTSHSLLDRGLRRQVDMCNQKWSLLFMRGHGRNHGFLYNRPLLPLLLFPPLVQGSLPASVVFEAVAPLCHHSPRPLPDNPLDGIFIPQQRRQHLGPALSGEESPRIWI